MVKDLPDWFMSIKNLIATPYMYQINYEATGELTIPASSSVTFYFGAGFTDTLEWIPTQYRWVFLSGDFSIDENSLILVEVMEEDKDNVGTYIVRFRKYGYGNVVISSNQVGVFIWDTRPVYRITNYNDVDVNLKFNVFGVLEYVGST